MANIAILDTGYAVKPNPINTTPSGNQFTMANSGSEILLKSVEVTFDCSCNQDTTNVPGQTNSSTGFLEGPEVNVVSVPPDTYVISGVASRAVSGDMTILGAIRQACKSKGVKMLYYTSTSDGYRDLTDTWGATTSAFSSTGGFTSGTTPVIFGRCSNFSVRQTGDKKLLRYNFTFTETT